MKLKNSCIIALVLIGCFCLAGHSEKAYAGHGTGNNDVPVIDGKCGSSVGFCCSDGAVSTCPHWHLVTKEVYNYLLDNKRIIGTFNEYDGGCRNDDWVVISGNKVPREGYKLYIHNLTSDISPAKSTKVHLSKVTGLDKIESKTDWKNTGAWWWFNDTAGKDENGNEITYAQLLEKTLKKFKLEEKDLAAFCMSTVIPPPPPVTPPSGDCGEWTPTSYMESNNSSGTTSVVSKVKNTTLGEGWKDTTYAKPSDELKWIHCYYPGVQVVAKNQSSSSLTGWQNKYTVKATDLRNPSNNSYEAELGNYDATSIDDTYSVQYKLAGKTLVETGTSGTPISATYTNGTLKVTDEGPASDHADAIVPYNFTNTAKIELTKSIVYAGEVATSKNTQVETKARQNNTTKASYATQVDNSNIKIISYISRSNGGSASVSIGSGRNYDICSAISNKTSCNTIYTDNGSTLHEKGYEAKTAGETVSTKIVSNRSFNVHDMTAGNYFCVAIGVYPANSGSDTNIDPKGSDSWYVSKPSCAKIAKKPSLQVWGSGIFSAGKIGLENSEKTIVSGILNDYNPSKTDRIVFGSWAEQNVVSNGKVNISSGASTGRPGNTNRTYRNTGGSYEESSSICIRSPLTMPNQSCSNSNNPGGDKGAINAPKDKEALVARFNSTSDSNYTLIENTTNISSMSIPKGTTRVYKSDNDITISGNITYENSGYTRIIDVPKVIIYSRKNIIINCGVSRVDAILIAEGSVRTCNIGTESKERGSTQLKINGTVITNRLYAYRTYGAGPGVYSAEPAEIINYDTSVYLWGSPRSDVSTSGKLDIVYRTELSPRY